MTDLQKLKIISPPAGGSVTNRSPIGHPSKALPVGRSLRVTDWPKNRSPLPVTDDRFAEADYVPLCPSIQLPQIGHQSAQGPLRVTDDRFSIYEPTRARKGLNLGFHKPVTSRRRAKQASR